MRESGKITQLVFSVLCCWLAANEGCGSPVEQQPTSSAPDSPSTSEHIQQPQIAETVVIANASAAVDILPPPPAESAHLNVLSSTPTTATRETGFSPESVRPFPKAGPRIIKRTLKRKQTEILTDTPVKKALEEERERTKGRKASKKKVLKTKKSGKVKASRKNDSDSKSVRRSLNLSCPMSLQTMHISLETRSKDMCIVCKDIGQDNELWYRCTWCGFWVHADCSGADSANSYVCDYCRDDSDTEN